MAVRPSCTTLLSLSTAPCRTVYIGATLRRMKKRITPSTGAQTRKTTASSGFIQNESPTPIISIIGPRTIGRKPPLMAFCRTVTSVVMRVISDEVSKWSRLEKA